MPVFAVTTYAYTRPGVYTSIQRTATRVKLVAVACVIGLSALLACAGETGPNPLLQPSPGFPCGIDGVVCTDATGHPNRMCCDQNEICGGSLGAVGCPDGSCCFEGSSNLMAGRKPHPQRPASAR